MAMRFLLLLGGLLVINSAWAQQPVLPSAPQPSAVPAAPATAPVSEADLMLGGRYEVTLQSGTTFTGTLTTISLDALEFDTNELGHLRVLRADLRQVRALAAARTTGLRPGYYDIGNGNRLFFGPTARNLRKGEGSAQDVWFFLAGVNYGITDNISVGGYLSLFPGVPLEYQLLMLTPKISFPIRENLHLGAGVLYIRVPDYDFFSSSGRGDNSFGTGLLYGAATFGSADNNVTLGLGYGFINNRGGNYIGSTPVLMVGGQKRVSRRISLLSENYIIADANAGMGGLYGFKINWKRLNLGYAAGYAVAFGSTGDDSRVALSYIYPVFLDLTFRFGRPYRPQP